MRQTFAYKTRINTVDSFKVKYNGIKKDDTNTPECQQFKDNCTISLLSFQQISNSVGNLLE